MNLELQSDRYYRLTVYHCQQLPFYTVEQVLRVFVLSSMSVNKTALSQESRRVLVH